MKKYFIVLSAFTFFGISASAQPGKNEVVIKNTPLPVKTDIPKIKPFQYLNTSIQQVNDVPFEGDLVIQYFNLSLTTGRSGSMQFDLFEGGRLICSVHFGDFQGGWSQGNLNFVVKKGQTLKVVGNPEAVIGTQVYLAGYTVSN